MPTIPSTAPTIPTTINISNGYIYFYLGGTDWILLEFAESLPSDFKAFIGTDLYIYWNQPMSYNEHTISNTGELLETVHYNDEGLYYPQAIYQSSFAVYSDNTFQTVVFAAGQSKPYIMPGSDYEEPGGGGDPGGPNYVYSPAEVGLRLSAWENYENIPTPWYTWHKWGLLVYADANITTNLITNPLDPNSWISYPFEFETCVCIDDEREAKGLCQVPRNPGAYINRVLLIPMVDLQTGESYYRIDIEFSGLTNYRYNGELVQTVLLPGIFFVKPEAFDHLGSINNIFVKEGTTWKPAISVQVKDGTEWKFPIQTYVKNNGVWEIN